MTTQRSVATRTVTLLLGDVEASTQRWEASAADAAGEFERFRSLTAAIVERHAGARPAEQGEGDSFVAAFAAAPQAVACALELQLAFAAGDGLRVRMALHTGEVLVSGDGRYSGPALNRCARVRALAHGGQTLLTQATREIVADALPAGTSLLDLGAHRLRGLGRPERAHQLCHDDLPVEFPPLTDADETPTNLPAHVTSLRGRAADLAEVVRLVHGARIVTLTGAGGVGKTRLGAEAAAALLNAFPDGVAWIELAPIGDPALVAHAVATHFSCKERTDEDVHRTLVRQLRHQRVLVALDNCEHVVTACAELAAAIARGCPHAQLLTTSREALGIEGEVCFRVPSLTIPAAVELFVDRAHQVRPEFALTDGTAPAVASICRRIDGIPLAIELAAARVRLLSPAQIDDGLADRFHLLTGGGRGALPRQRTLEASVEWSYRLLDAREQALLDRLAVFAGGFDLQGAEEVCAGGAVDRDAVLDLLAGLVDKSLVQVDAERAPARYRLLETIRAYALGKLMAGTEVADVRARHLDYFLALAERVAPELRGTGFDAAAAVLDTELENVRTALAWALASGQVEQHLRIITALSAYWMVRSMFGEARANLDAAVGAAEANAVLRAMALGVASLMTVLDGNIRRAAALADEAVELARDTGDPRALELSLSMLGFNKFWLGKGGLPEVVEALELSEGASELARARMFRGVLESNLDGPARGRPWFERSMEGSERAGDLHGFGLCSLFLGQALVHAGQLLEARRILERALDALHTVRNDTFAVLALCELGKCALFSGDVGRAGELLDEAETLAEETGRLARGNAMTYRALHRLAIADARDARTSIETALSEWQEQGNMWQTGLLRVLRAEVALLTGDVDSARALADDAVEACRAAGVRWQVGLALHARVRVAVAEAEWQHAGALAHEALRTMVASGSLMGVAGVLESLAEIATATGGHVEAARLFGAAARMREDLGAVRLPVADAAYHAAVDATRDALAGGYDEAFAAGHALAADEAIAYATRGRGERRRPPGGWDSLTPAEVEVVRAVAAGLSNPEIAAKLFVTRDTVKTHLRHVFAKLGVGSRAELAAAATRRGL